MTQGNSKRRVAVRSAATRALISEGALKRGEERSDGVRERVRAAITTIEKELAANDGIYPHNKGALSAAEVARRADIHPTTFFSPKQRQLGAEVKNWLEAIKSKRVIGRGRVRRELADRVSDWKRLYEGLAQSHRDTELALQQAQAELEEARAETSKLNVEVERLQLLIGQAAKAKVVPMRRKKD